MLINNHAGGLSHLLKAKEVFEIKLGIKTVYYYYLIST